MLRVTTSSTSGKMALAASHLAANRFREAERLCREVLAGDPRHADALHYLGMLGMIAGHGEEAEPLLRGALAEAPGDARIWKTLGGLLHKLGRSDELIDMLTEAATLFPNDAEIHYNLGSALGLVGYMRESIASLRRAVAMQPESAPMNSSLLYALSFDPAMDAAAIGMEHRLWNQRAAQRLSAALPPHRHDRSPDRRLRIGYVSPDLRQHAVGRFISPLFARHDHERFEIFAYHDSPSGDATTERLKSQVDHWRNVHGMPDTALVDLIRTDGIDILVDLTMHMIHNRMLVFARKPAPLQVTYLAYCGTTGLSAMDYRISDPHLDPVSHGELEAQWYAERTLRVPSYWCYEAPAEASPPMPRPAGAPITFGCLNLFAKVSAPALQAWAKILSALPESRLVLHAPPGRHRRRAIDVLAGGGISAARVEFVEHAPMAQYLARYHAIDIALDPFPCGGGTTSCDALYMGVPVVTLRGKTAVGRGGTSILSQIALHDLVADSADQYVQIALDLARDVPRRAALRSDLRHRLESSPLMNAQAFTSGMEDQYQQIWKTWCGARSA